MAKTLMNTKTKEVRRVSDDEAAQLVASGQYRYIGKMEGKRLLKPAAQPNA